ncbi:MAG TPA: TorF family putative porin [Caulobacteraceae bacterium]
MTAGASASARRRLRRLARRPTGWALAVGLVAGAAEAQVSVSLTAQSDYLLRGVSLSDGRPTLTLDVNYDDKSGFYGALSATAVDTRNAGAEVLGFVADAGYAKRLTNGLTWDVGVTDSQISTYVDNRYVANYAEAYGGLSRGGLAAHLYFSPDYLGESVQTLYLDLSGSIRPADRWRLFAHAGLLAVVGGDADVLGGRDHLDFRAGVARQFGRFEARITGSWAEPAPVYPEGVRHGHGTLVAGASVFF